MAAQVSETIAKEAVHWVNSFNGLFIKHCRLLADDTLKLRLFQLDASRIIAYEVAASKDSVYSLEAFALRLYENLWLRATGKPRSELNSGPTKKKTLSYSLLVNFPALEARLKSAGDERLGLTQYVSDMVADFPFRPIIPPAPRQSLSGGQSAPAPSKYYFATKLAAELDAAYPFPNCTYEGPDNAVRAMVPWAVPVPLRLNVRDYVRKDMGLMQPSLRWVSIRYNHPTHSLRPILSEAFAAELQQPTHLADVPHVLQAYMQLHGFLSGWVWKMAETKRAVPFCICWDKRMQEAAAKETDVLATRHPMWVDADAVARIRNVQLEEEVEIIARDEAPEDDVW